MIFGDQSWPVESLAKTLPAKSEVSVWIEGRGWILGEAPSLARLSETRQTVKARSTFLSNAASAAATFLLSESSDDDGSSESYAIVGFQNPSVSQKVVEALKAHKKPFKILHVGAKGSRAVLGQKKRSVAWSDLMSVGMDTEIHLLNVQERVRELRELFKESERIALLLQDDPDPDGLASALALRKLLGRNAQTAPIVSFGKITRPENVAMSRLLEIEVEKAESVDFPGYDKVMLVDCQPSFFKGRKIRADALFDHHPRAPQSEADLSKLEFCELREDLGSISTLMTQYLRAADIDVSQRLATALLYGIKSDTLMLNREVSESDLDAFLYLYPRINNNTLRKIERPELPLGYLECLRKALSYFKVVKGVAVLNLGRVDREEWIPQAADFALQVEGAEWALGCGIFDDKVIISARNCGYIEHCGDLFKSAFQGIGCAGGHRTMAKAIIKKSDWDKRFGAGSTSPALMATKIRRVLQKFLAEHLA